MDLSEKKRALQWAQGGRASHGNEPARPDSAWTFLSNHAHVLAYLAEHPSARVRDVAADVGITERSAMRLITQLDQAGIIQRTRQGRRNHYLIDVNAPLMHPLEAHCTVGQLLEGVISRESLERLQHQGNQAQGKES